MKRLCDKKKIVKKKDCFVDGAGSLVWFEGCGCKGKLVIGKLYKALVWLHLCGGCITRMILYKWFRFGPAQSNIGLQMLADLKKTYLNGLFLTFNLKSTLYYQGWQYLWQEGICTSRDI